MAGIGFELRKLMKDGSFLGVLRAYGFAGMISSGPWVISIVGVMLVGLFSVRPGSANPGVVPFLVSVTYLMAASLILTGVLQLLFSRFVADRLFEENESVVVPNLLGALALTGVITTGLGTAVVLIGFTGEPLLVRVWLVADFAILSMTWVVVVLLSGLKAYQAVVLVFAIGYGLSFAAALALRRFGLGGLLAGFGVGQAALLFAMLFLVVRRYRTTALVAYGFVDRRHIFPSLAFTGLFYNLGIWIDKLIFWANPMTSEPVIGPFRASVIYDLPIFLAYLSIVPGMAVFLMRLETDFAEQHSLFYDAVRQGDTLGHIEALKDRLVFTVRQGIYEIFKVQGLAVLLLLLAGPRLLAALKISPLYLPLYNIDLIGVGVQVLLLAVLNVLFYLDLRLIALGLCVGFCIANAGLTVLSQLWGAPYYGYGFAVSVSVASLVGLAILSRKLDRLEYETFMLQ